MRYVIFALSTYIVGNLIYDMWLPCMVIAIMSVLKLIYITVYDYAQRNNKITGKDLKDFSDKELFDEIFRRKK